MPWKESTPMSERKAFVVQAERREKTFSALCQEYGISRKTGYKWLKQFREQGAAGLADHSRRPHRHPKQTTLVIEAQVLAVRDRHPAWGGRKIKRWLENKGREGIPSASTITSILHRNHQIDPEESIKHRAMTRFEMDRPNQLWQMDFKGRFPLASGQECHPLVVLDDHSRFLLGLNACQNERKETVQACLTNHFRTYGLPDRMLMDNGAPWGDEICTPYTIFTTWLLRLGIGISHGRPYHPQTQGKTERLNRTLKAEVLTHSQLSDFMQCQIAFDDWRSTYNLERPHEALSLEPPVTRYLPSCRPFPESLPPLRFPDGATIRKVDEAGLISVNSHRLRVGRAFRGLHVGFLWDPIKDGLLHVYFNEMLIQSFDIGY